MPPNHSSSAFDSSMARISSFGVTLSLSMLKSFFISGVSLIDFALRSKTPPPFEILRLS